MWRRNARCGPKSSIELSGPLSSLSGDVPRSAGHLTERNDFAGPYMVQTKRKKKDSIYSREIIIMLHRFLTGAPTVTVASAPYMYRTGDRSPKTATYKTGDWFLRQDA